MGDSLSTEKVALLRTLTLDNQTTERARSTRPLQICVLVLLVGLLGSWWGTGWSSEPAGQDKAISLMAPPLRVAGSAGTPQGLVEPRITLESTTSPSPLSTNQSAVVQLEASGYVVARQIATVSARTTGEVRDVFIEEGDKIKAGELMAQLDDTIARARLKLAQSQATAAASALGELEIKLHHANRSLARGETLAARDMLSSSALNELQQDAESIEARLVGARAAAKVTQRAVQLKRAELQDLEIRAPFSGIVVNKAAQAGEIVSPMSAGGGFTRTGIGTIVDMDSLEVEVEVSETHIYAVKPGQPVRVLLNAYPKDPYPGEVIAIIPTADRSKGTIRIRAGLQPHRRTCLARNGRKGGVSAAVNINLLYVAIDGMAIALNDDGRHSVFSPCAQAHRLDSAYVGVGQRQLHHFQPARLRSSDRSTLSGQTLGLSMQCSIFCATQQRVSPCCSVIGSFVTVSRFRAFSSLLFASAAVSGRTTRLDTW